MIIGRPKLTQINRMCVFQSAREGLSAPRPNVIHDALVERGARLKGGILKPVSMTSANASDVSRLPLEAPLVDRSRQARMLRSGPHRLPAPCSGFA